jgi:GMP synthase-like glutamine amidotransferase
MRRKLQTSFLGQIQDVDLICLGIASGYELAFLDQRTYHAEMRIHILQHTIETPPGSVLDWLKARGHSFSITRFFAADALPEAKDIDWLIICGGGMGVHDIDRYPWLENEKRLIKAVIERGSVVLGLCLGGQLIAEACGADVRRHAHWEVGWHPVKFEDGCELTVFQFHQDTFGIPNGATRLASNAICANQGFIYKERVVGLQFHPEATETWVRSCASEREYPAGPHVQTPDQVLARLDALAPLREWFFALLDRMCSTYSSGADSGTADENETNASTIRANG